VLPYEGKNPAKPATLTVICTAASEADAQKLVEATKTYVAEHKLSQTELITKQSGARCYFNLSPTSEWEPMAEQFAGWLKEQGGDQFRFQLESGPGITE
jgi:hypothetical protein